MPRSLVLSAVAAQPDYFVIGDSHFFENPGLAEQAGLRIVTASQFLEPPEQDVGGA